MEEQKLDDVALRFLEIMEYASMNHASLAEKIGVNNSTITHIMWGRNTVSISVLQKTLTAFPEVNAEYILLGKGELIKSDYKPTNQLEMTNDNLNQNLYQAVESDDLQRVITVLHSEKLNAATYYGSRALLLAVENGNPEILRLLLESSKNINRKSFWKRTELSVLRAAQNGKNPEIMEILLEYCAGQDKKLLARALMQTDSTNTDTSKFSYEDGVYIPVKSSKNYRFVQSAKEGNIRKIQKALEEGMDKNVFVDAVEAALSKSHWEIANLLTDHIYERDIDIYEECIKRLFQKSLHCGDVERIKFYLEKMVIRTVGVLTDETGRSTLEIALEKNPADLIRLLANYGINEKILQLAYQNINLKN